MSKKKSHDWIVVNEEDTVHHLKEFENGDFATIIICPDGTAECDIAEKGECDGDGVYVTRSFPPDRFKNPLEVGKWWIEHMEGHLSFMRTEMAEFHI